MDIPDYLYRYFDINGDINRGLSRSSVVVKAALGNLWASRRSSFNDHTEKHGYFIKLNKIDGARLNRSIRKTLKNPNSKRLSERSRNPSEVLRDTGGGYGIVCLSEVPPEESSYMSAVYAGRGSGCCLRFRVESTIISSELTVGKVSYVSQPSPVGYLMATSNPKDFVRKAFLQKDICWAQEREWRFIFNTPDAYANLLETPGVRLVPDALYFYPDSDPKVIADIQESINNKITPSIAYLSVENEHGSFRYKVVSSPNRKSRRKQNDKPN